MKNVSGIYKILNKINGKFYIGSAEDFEQRWYKKPSSHLKTLEKNIHCNRYLQRAWNKYGKDKFEFLIVEECSIEKLIEREQYYLDLWEPWKEEIGYNICKFAGSPLGLRWTEESKKKIRGEKSFHSKLTWDDVNNIRNFFCNKKATINQLAEKYKVCISTIHEIVFNLIWFDKNYIVPKKRINGENNSNSKLTQIQVDEIRKLYKAGRFSQYKIANIYKVSRSLIGLIVNHQRWKTS
jgi:group I intron endonuclease